MNDVIPGTNNSMTDYRPSESVVQVFPPGRQRGDIGAYFPEVAIDELAGNRNIGKAVYRPISTAPNLERPDMKIAMNPANAKEAVETYRKHLQGHTEGQLVSIIA